MQEILEQAVYEDRVVRRHVHHALRVFVEEIMQGYLDYREYRRPLSDNENYLIGWHMAEKN